MTRPEYVLIVNNPSANVLGGVEDAFKVLGMSNLQGLLLTANPDQYKADAERAFPVEVIACSFKTDKEIATALRPFKSDIRAVVCGGEKHIQYLRKVIPHLPPKVRVATPEVLEISTNKRLMREAFHRHCPDITPRFVQVHDDSSSTMKTIERQLAYPVIVKPANLASSLLIQSCHSHTELKAALARMFARVGTVYQREGRASAPEVIVEEYLEGDFYSIDAYVMKVGEVYFCPPVGYVPAKKLGIDDFFLYKRFIPTVLTAEEIAGANQTVARALAAVKLTHSSAHVELVLTKHGWKIIELGPRIGRFRQVMYGLAYGINHYLNDVLIHFGQKPRIADKLLQHCSGYIIYPEAEGTLREITGIDGLEGHPSTKFLRVFAKPGDTCLHAKHGGRALAEFVIADSDAAKFQKITAFVEDKVKAVVDKAAPVA